MLARSKRKVSVSRKTKQVATPAEEDPTEISGLQSRIKVRQVKDIHYYSNAILVTCLRVKHCCLEHYPSRLGSSLIHLAIPNLSLCHD